MRTAAGVLVVVALSLHGVTVDAAPSPELRTLFPRQAEFAVERHGLTRLVLPVEVVAACRSDLSDLRLFDADGREVPFVLDGRGVADEVELRRSIEPAVLEIERSEILRENAPALRRETYDIAWSATAPPNGSWSLRIRSERPEFVARVRVEGITGSGARVALAAQSLFRLAGKRRTEKLDLALPRFEGKRVRVVLETEHPFWLEPSLQLQSSRSFAYGGRIVVPLEVASVHRTADTTVVSLSRPRGVIPDVLRLETTTGTFDRTIEVRDEGSGRGAAVLGSGKVFRVEAWVPVEDRDIRLRPASGERLRVEIEDGDSPPLDAIRFEAVVRQPALIFSVAAGKGGRAAGVMRFGGGRAHRPRYDVSGLLPPPQGAAGNRARAAAALFDPSEVGVAHLLEIVPNPDYDGSPALAFAMRPGAEIDTRRFSHVRRVHVGNAAEGLSRLELAPDDLAVLRTDLADLRIADSESRQWPYLIDRDADSRLVPLRIEGPDREDRTSRYVLHPPVTPIRIDQLVLNSDALFFDRAFRLIGIDEDGNKRQLAAGRIRRTIDDPRPLELDVSALRVSLLELSIEDGDDASLALRTAEGRVRLPEVYLTATAGDYDMLLGSPDEDAPRYELERVRDVVLAVEAVPVEIDGLQSNPDFRITSRLMERDTGQRVLLWVALIAAVAILATLTLRLARK